MAIKLKPVDVAVVGLGAAGGVAVLPLARAGLKVAGIEAGGWMDPHTFRPDEIYNVVRHQVTTTPKAQLETPTVRMTESAPARRVAPHPMMNAVGGTSIHYWAQSWRLNPWDFRARSESIRRYGPGSIPKGSTLEDWPVGYDELEPFYDTIEHEVGVSGKAGNIGGRIDPAGNIHEGPRRREYPMPPLRGSGFTDLMADVAKKLGWHPFRPPAGINSQTYAGRPGCVYHGNCAAGGCHIGAKNSTAVSTIPEALKTKNLTVFDRAHATRIESDGEGRVTGVTYLRGGKEYFQPAKAVLIGSYTWENTRLLLLSKSKAYPKGLSNNHGQVGRHYMAHWDGWAGVSVDALFPFDLNTWYGLPAQGTCVDDWADDNFDHTGLGFIGGANLHVYTELHPIEASGMNTFGKAPPFGSAWKKFIRENGGRRAKCYVQTSSFPYETGYLDLDDAVKDPLGQPVIRITIGGTKENERRAGQFAQNKMEEWYRAAGAIEVTKGNPVGAGLSTHTYGGTRMGDNPETNVVNRWGFSHEAGNLGMLGGSVFGTSGARNPTLTIMALAWRTADYLAKNWKTVAG